MAYTPIFDGIAQLDKTNLSDVAVFGTVWRYAQGDLKKCTASPESMADRIGVTHNTVRASLKKLCGLGLIQDLTPDVKYKPHEFIPTDKALTLIAGELQEEDRLPNSGNLNNGEGYQEMVGRLPNSGRLGYQNLKDRLPNSGNKETLNNNIRDKEENRAGEKISSGDPLTDVFNKQGQPLEATGDNPVDQHFGYRDEFLKIYQEMTGEYPDRVKKDEIIRVAQEGNVTPECWREGWRTTKLNWTGMGKNPPIARVVEVCEKAEGDYEKYKLWKWPAVTNGRDSPGTAQGKVTLPVVSKAKGGGFDV